MHVTEQQRIEIWSENLNISDHMEDLGTDGRIMNTLLQKQGGWL